MSAIPIVPVRRTESTPIDVFEGNQIIERVAAYYGLTPEALKRSRRSIMGALPKQIAMALVHEFTSLSLPRIGLLFGKHHTTVLHGIRHVRDLEARDPKIAELLARFRRAGRGMDEWPSSALESEPPQVSPVGSFHEHVLTANLQKASAVMASLTKAVEELTQAVMLVRAELARHRREKEALRAQ